MSGDGTPRPLAGVIVLRRAHGEPAAVPLLGFDRVSTLVRSCWHRFAIAALHEQSDHFAWAVGLGREVAVTAVEMPRDGADPDVAADAILGALDGEREPS